ncbi:MAG: DUF6542 domain-containing protein [Mycolicibacterium sp.]|uniref:DUF6542 domain-containing protein n=1 Tax=Mycolicibacterium sp. TaxID=2320850 RepID=UPI003D0CB1CF
MSGQRARSSVPAHYRSAHPNIPGVPWWGAVLIAVVAAATGFAIDAASGDKELTGVFAALYALGCLAAVVAVRQAAVFTSVIQPPLILFVMVPGSYYLMHASDIHGIKDVLINCGYPLIERFPLMFFTSAAVLVIGAARWYLGASSRQDTTTADRGAKAADGRLAGKLAALMGTGTGVENEQRRRHSVGRRPGGAGKPAGNRAARPATGRPVKRGAPPRSRHARPPESDVAPPRMDANPPRARRPRPNDPMPPTEPRRRPRPAEREPGRAAPPNERRSAYDRAERRDRTPQRRRHDDYEPLEPHRPMGNGSHHPVSRVRYRGADGSDDRPDYRRRGQRSGGADQWEYDI